MGGWETIRPWIPITTEFQFLKERSHMKSLHWIALVLVVVGAINWGLVGLFQFDLVATLFGGPSATLSRVVYALVGLSGIVVAATSAALAGTPRVSVSHQAAR
jgi:uncharacterized membrane protein YuzA (DUF378 family)